MHFWKVPVILYNHNEVCLWVSACKVRSLPLFHAAFWADPGLFTTSKNRDMLLASLQKRVQKRMMMYRTPLSYQITNFLNCYL